MYQHFTQEPARHNQAKYNHLNRYIEVIFHGQGHKLQRVKELAQKVKKGIDEISPFIQQSTEVVCPGCTDICCIHKHGYYNHEDLVYIHALGLKPPDYDFQKEDTTPCQFLSEKGCVMNRSVRPSGCNWYVCGPLFDHMEDRPEYRKFDDDLRNVAELWLEMMDEFHRVVKGLDTE